MTLTRDKLIERLRPIQTGGLDPIFVTPMLDFEDQMGAASIDVRLGKQFLVFRDHVAGVFSPAEDSRQMLAKYQEEIVVPFGHGITLHPGKLIIGSTLEYVSVPGDLECQVEGRSSLARLGLIIATATTVEPNFKGVITLELSNTGTIPIELFPGLKIAQLLFHQTSGNVKAGTLASKKKYQYSIGPGFSKVGIDKHIKYFCKKR